MYLLSFAALFLLLISTIKLAFTKKISWQKGDFDNLLILFLISLSISIIIASPNKIQALLNPNFGFLTFFSLTIIYLYLSRINTNKKTDYYYLSLSISATFLSILTIVFFFQPLKNINLPQSLQFLKNPNFTPIGNNLDLAIFLGFYLLYGLTKFFEKKQIITYQKLTLNFLLLVFNLIAFILTVYSLFKPTLTNTNQSQSLLNNLPPFRLSWYAAVEILKNPITAFFGVGIDNFASIFTKVKDVMYNQSNLWLIYSFNFSRSAFLHLFTETGILGFLIFLLLIYQIIKLTIRENNLLIIISYLLLIIFLFPPSLITWFLLFLMLSNISSKNQSLITNNENNNKIDLSNLFPIYLGLIIFSLISIGVSGYLLGRAYAAEYYFRESLVSKNINQMYQKQFKAIQLNPYIERFHREYAFLNLNIALNVTLKELQKISSEEKNIEKNKQKIEELKLEFYSLVNQAINEGKWLIKLNSQNAINWANLAEIYQNIIGQAEKADLFSISAYLRAIVADPQNPVYRLSLGGIYYSLKNYDEAVKMFEQAVILKPDWPNAYYNLAWANYQKQNYQAAVSAMENVIRLLDPNKDKTDYEKAKKELEEFKKKLPKDEEKSTSEETTDSKLTLPSPIPTLNPQIKLPKEASPEADN